MNKTDRIDWVDISKGIAIILVIIGHTMEDPVPEQIVRGIIYSFHMPLFFILSGRTSKMSEDNNQFVRRTEKNFLKLILPALVLSGIKIFANAVQNQFVFEAGSDIAQLINTLIFASGVSVKIGNAVIPPLGIPWFFISMFISKTLFDYLHLKLDNVKFAVSIFVCCALGLFFGNFQWLPFSMDISLAELPFYYFGYLLKKSDMKKNVYRNSLFSLIVWGIILLCSYLIKYEYMELSSRRYTLFPLCYIGAISGTLFVSYFSIIISGIRITKYIREIGRNSIYLLCVHIMDFLFRNIYMITDNDFINAAVRTVLDCIILAGLLAVKGRKRPGTQKIIPGPQ